MEEFFLRNPWIRSLLPLLLMGGASFTVSALVVEVSSGNEILWAKIPEKVSFYIFLLSTFFLCVYQILISKHDREFIKGLTPKQYEAKIRNRVAEGVAKRSKKLISEGKIDQLEQETETFKKLYGEAK